MRKTTEMDVKTRREGAWFGLAVGDALGAPFEFLTAAQVAAKMPGPLRMQASSVWLSGEWTDDTALTLATAQAYNHQDGTFRVHYAARAMTTWLASEPKDVGSLTRTALQLIARGASPQQSGRLAAHGNDRAAGNGSLMRALPTGLVRAASDPLLARESAILSAITHADPRCIDACIAYNTVVSALIAEPENTRGALQLGKGIAQQAEVKGLIDDLLHDRPARFNNDGGIGFVLLALELAFRILLHSASFEEGLERAVRYGGDTDTNAAIAGGLLGARFGIEAIPAHWLAELRDKAVLSREFSRLVACLGPAE